MDFKDSPQEAEFRKTARSWLDRCAPEFLISESMSADEQLKLGRQWQALKAEQNYVKISWPLEEGGGGRSIVEQIIFDEEEARHALPVRFFRLSLNIPLPIIRRFGTDEQKQRFLKPALRGDEIWCQLFSEPAAGSDLAGIRLRAVKDGNEWVLNGQKVWNSYADISDFGMVLTRSDPSLRKHKGLTYFFLDMNSPGVEVRPIRQLSGGSEYCEVFFTDVRVPDSQRLGGVNDGWRMALATLMEERFPVSDPAGGGPGLNELIRLAQSVRQGKTMAIDNAAVRNQIADWFVTENGIRAFNLRARDKIAKGGAAGPEGSLNKLVIASRLRKGGAYAIDLMGLGGLIGKPGGFRANDFTVAWMEGHAMRIAGGTDEILRNIIAERILQLPPDVRVDKEVAFNEL